jgi:hypothetical protein
MYNRPLLAVVLVLSALGAAAQYKKAPDPYKERNEVNGQILRGAYKGFDVLTFGLSAKGTMDTTDIDHYEYYPSGLIKEATHYDYGTWSDIKGLSFAGRLSMLKDGDRITYTYDADGNMLIKRKYQLAPANSYIALQETALRPAMAGRGPEDEGHPNMGKAIDNIDSLIAAGIPEIENITASERYAYDKDGNTLYSVDSITRRETRYRYRYDKKKRVAMERRTENSQYKFTEYYFGYDKRGNVDTINVYKSDGDTTVAATPQNMVYATRRKYNKGNKMTQEVFTTYERRYSISKKNMYTYKDTLIAGLVTINLSRNDTEALYVNNYNDRNKLTLQKNYVFSGGKRSLINTEAYSYDTAGNISEVLYSRQGMEPGAKEVLYKRELFVLYK